LLLGAPAYVIKAFLKKSHSFERDGRTLPSWFATEFPTVGGTEDYLVGYEVCEVVRQFVRDHSFSGLSIMEILKSSDCVGVRQAEVFLSHSQAEPINSTVHAMENHDRRRCRYHRYFIDYLTIRQGLKGDFKPATVASVVEAIQCSLLVLSPVSSPMTLSRGWCVYEVVCTLKARARLLVTLDISSELVPKTVQRMCCRSRGDREETKAESIVRVFGVLQQNMTVRLQDATTHEPNDKEMILESMRRGRDDALNLTDAQAEANISNANLQVEGGIRKAIVKEMERLKVEYLFYLLPRCSCERLVLSLLWGCFGWAENSENPSDRTQASPQHHPSNRSPCSLRRECGAQKRRGLCVLEQCCLMPACLLSLT